MTTVRDFTITRFSFRRDRIIGDSQVRADCCHAAALELCVHRTTNTTSM
jgi:hypothetical protein